MAFDPATAALALQGVSLIGNLGSSLLGRNDQRDALRKAEEENKRRMAQANLSRAFGGNPAVDLVQPKLKQGLGTKILGGVGTAAGIGAQGLGLYNQAKALTAQTAGRELTNQNLIDEAAIRRGMLEAGALSDSDIGDIGTIRSGASKIGAQAAGGGLPGLGQFAESQAAPQGISRIGQRAPQTSTVGLPEPSSMLSELGNLSFQGGVQNRREGLDATKRSLEQQALQNELTTSNIGLNNARAADLRRPTGLTAGEVAQKKANFSQLASAVESHGKLGTPYAELVENPAFANLSSDETFALRSAYDLAAYERAAETNVAVADFLYKDLKTKFATDLVLRKSGDMQYGMGLMASGYGQANGAGDLQMINAFVRLNDPGVSVRPMEALEVEKVQAIFDKYGLDLAANKMITGDKFLDAGRNQILDAARDLYEQQFSLINDKLDLEITSAVPHFINLGGTRDAMLPFIDTYKLRPYEDFKIARRDAGGSSSSFDAEAESTGNASTDLLRRRN